MPACDALQRNRRGVAIGWSSMWGDAFCSRQSHDDTGREWMMGKRRAGHRIGGLAGRDQRHLP